MLLIHGGAFGLAMPPLPIVVGPMTRPTKLVFMSGNFFPLPHGRGSVKKCDAFTARRVRVWTALVYKGPAIRGSTRLRFRAGS